jgi:hypothetical protein
MNLVLHIFKKDARRFWPEILVSLAITGALVRAYPLEWVQEASMQSVFGGSLFSWNLLSRSLTVLIPVSWWLLVSRVVHAERLVGDRQYWLIQNPARHVRQVQGRPGHLGFDARSDGRGVAAASAD